MKSKLNLDPKVVDSARQHAANIAHDMQEFIERHTTVSTERTIVRLLGVDGVDDVDTPLPNVVVDQIKEAGALPTGAAYWMGNAMVQTGKSAQEIAEEMGLEKQEVVIALEAIVEPASLFDSAYNDGGDTIFIMDQVADKQNDGDWLDELQMKDSIEALNQREKSILALRFLGGMTQMEVASRVGISQAQVSRLEKNALNRIKESLGAS